MPDQGIALAYPYYEDLSAVNASWWYVWGPCPDNAPPGCIPMSYAGEDPQLPQDYNGYVLLFNEPNNPAPFGGTLTPQEALVKYMQLCYRYSHIKWVVGNVNLFYRKWMDTFYDLCFTTYGCRPPKYIGWHIYTEDDSEVDHIGLFLDGIHTYEYPGTKWWITEFADVDGDVYCDAVLLNEFKKRPWIERWAYFTNRAKGDEPWYPETWTVELFDWDTGEPTDIGRWYMGELHNTCMPVVMR